MKHIKLYEEFLNESSVNEKSNDVITMNGDIDFSMQGEADAKKEIAKFEKKYKVKIKATGKSYNTATLEYEITGKKKDIIKFYVDGMEWPEEDLEDSYPELFESLYVNEAQKPEIDELELGAVDHRFRPEDLELAVWYDRETWTPAEVEKAAKGKDPGQLASLERVLKPKGFKIDPSGKHDYYPDELCIVWKLKKR